MTAQRLPLFRPGWVIYLLPAFLSVIAAFVLGTMRGAPQLTPDFQHQDKVGHLVAFALIQVTHVRAAEFIWYPEKSKRFAWGACASAVTVGAMLELWQAFLPYRTAEWLDLVADATGAGIAALVYIFAQRRA